MLKRIVPVILSIFIILTFAACSSKISQQDNQKSGSEQQNNTQKDSTSDGQTAQKTSYPLTIKDSYKREVTIEKEPQRVVSLGPNITEMIYALGASEKLVGRTDFCDYPEEAKKVESIGPIQGMNIEKIASLKPDLIIASALVTQDAVKKLEELGLKVVALYSDEDFDGAYQTIGDVGKVLNRQAKASEIISDMKKKVQDVLDRVKGKGTPSVYYIVSYGQYGDYTAGKDTFIGKAIEMAGGKNAAGDVEGWKYSLEKLVEKNPDILICSKYFDSKKGIESTNGYKDLKAVKEGKLFEIDNNMLDRQGVRYADGLVELAKIIHPEAFK